jgi:LCP family protein required for cell wall assembly
VGVATADGDIVLLADDGTGWKVVGAYLPRFDLDPWYGESVRHVLVVGTDARPGQSQELFRADSIHILSSNLPEGRGAVLGFPRDAYVQASYGMDKFTHVNALSDRHTEEMVDIAAELSSLPIDGYLLTGFLGFIRLVNDFGGVVVDVPYRMNDWRAEANLFAGTQRLWGEAALAFSRIRSIPGGDFTRSGHQGVVVLAALGEIAGGDITRLPELLSILTRHTWTNLSPGDLLTLAAAGFLVDPTTVENKVLPGTVTTRGGASVVVLDEVRSEEMYRDLDDGFFDQPQGD